MCTKNALSFQRRPTSTPYPNVGRTFERFRTSDRKLRWMLMEMYQPLSRSWLSSSAFTIGLGDALWQDAGLPPEIPRVVAVSADDPDQFSELLLPVTPELDISATGRGFRASAKLAPLERINLFLPTLTNGRVRRHQGHRHRVRAWLLSHGPLLAPLPRRLRRKPLGYAATLTMRPCRAPFGRIRIPLRELRS